MATKRIPFLVSLVMLTVLCLPTASGAVPTADEMAVPPIAACANGAFSTEEDFIARDVPIFDGNPYISDGDMLSFNGQVCMRNHNLLAAWFVGAIGPDLGLDALDVLDVDKPFIAFSTEVDDPLGRFTSGDLLFTPGNAIPNIALVKPFNITWDIGLDGVQLIGKTEDVLRFVNALPNYPREVLVKNPDLLRNELLQRYSVDIWFTVEGTAFIGTRSQVLDGDLLSAATGTIVFSQAALLPPDVPAGLPDRGVDFGLDGVVSPRDRETARRMLYFSTEILYDGEKISFTDGDVLRLGDGIARTNWDLIKAFHPAADFLGLDALSVLFNPPPLRDPNIQSMCGELPVADFDGGVVPPNEGGTGLYRANSAIAPPGDLPRRPCGEYVPIDGFLPATGVTRFRVAYRPFTDLRPAAGTARGVQTHWLIKEWFGWPINNCLPVTDLNTDLAGWMPASTYLDAKSGALTGCANSGMRLAVWDTNNKMGLGPATEAERNGHYVLWLEWEDTGGILHQEPVEHHLQLDNTLPRIAPYPAGLQVHLPGSPSPVPACGEAPTGNSNFEVWGQFADLYYWNFHLEVRGGSPPAWVSYGPHNYYDPHDGTPPLKNTDDTGTTPDGTTVHLRNINLALPWPDGLGASFKRCCYVLDLWVRDAAIRHVFNRIVATDNSGSSAYQANSFVTFEAGGP